MARRASLVFLSLVLSLSLLAPTFATDTWTYCTGNPPTYNGLPCATTTRYYDGQEGACGCGTSAGPYSWQYEGYTAAGSQAIFEGGGSDPTWCGAGCGSCYELTPSGDCPYGDPCATETATITVMVTNLCPYAGNEVWCPNAGSDNEWGFYAHFDLMDYNMDGLITDLGWNNPIVTYKQVACDTGSILTPTCADAAECVCTTQSQCSNSTTGSSSSASSSSKQSSTSTGKASTATTSAATTGNMATTSKSESATTSTSSKSESATTSASTTSATKSSSTTAAASSSSAVSVTVYNSANSWWFAITVSGASADSIASVQVKDSGSYSTYSAMTSESWGYYKATTGSAFTAPLTVLMTSTSGSTATATVATITPNLVVSASGSL